MLSPEINSKPKDAINTAYSKKAQNKSPINKRDPKEIHAIIREKNKIEIIKAKLSEKRREVEDTKEEIRKLFNKSNNKETELKNYIAELNSKMINYETNPDDRIDDQHKNIMSMIAEIQEKVKMEINFTKKEMEKEVLSKFFDAEQNQQKLMTEKIEEQKKVFEKMNNTKNEIEKIKKHFEHTNNQCESLSKENENLRINLQSYEEDNQSLENKIKTIRQEYNQLLKENQKLLENENNNNTNNYEIDNNIENEENSEELIFNKKFDSEYNDTKERIFNFNVNLSRQVSLKKTTTNNNKLTKSNFMPKIKSKIVQNETEINFNEFINNEYFNNSYDLIKSLKQNIKDVKNDYKIIHKNYIVEIKQRNESQQLIQKCIEDLKLEINKTAKDISNFTKINHTQLQFSLNKKIEEQLVAKQNHFNSLENKIKILTFVYDNGFQNTKAKKNKLMASSYNFYSKK